MVHARIIDCLWLIILGNFLRWLRSVCCIEASMIFVLDGPFPVANTVFNFSRILCKFQMSAPGVQHCCSSHGLYLAPSNEYITRMSLIKFRGIIYFVFSVCHIINCWSIHTFLVPKHKLFPSHCRPALGILGESSHI